MRVPVLSVNKYSMRPNSSGIVLVLTTVSGISCNEVNIDELKKKKERKKERKK